VYIDKCDDNPTDGKVQNMTSAYTLSGQ